MTPSGSRSAIVDPGDSCLARSSVTSSVIGIGQITPLARRMDSQTGS